MTTDQSVGIMDRFSELAEDAILCPFVSSFEEITDTATRFSCELNMRYLLEHYYLAEGQAMDRYLGTEVVVGAESRQSESAFFDMVLRARQLTSAYDFIEHRPLLVHAAGWRDSVLPPARSLLEGVLRLAGPEASTPALAAIPRLLELAGLPRGWDGYDAEPIHQAVVDRAFDTLIRLAAQAIRSNVPLSRPAVSASPAGSIHFEWDVPGGFLDVECPPEPEPLSFLMEPRGGSEVEDIASSPEALWVKVSAVFA